MPLAGRHHVLLPAAIGRPSLKELHAILFCLRCLRLFATEASPLRSAADADDAEKGEQERESTPSPAHAPDLMPSCRSARHHACHFPLIFHATIQRGMEEGTPATRISFAISFRPEFSPPHRKHSIEPHSMSTGFSRPQVPVQNPNKQKMNREYSISSVSTEGIRSPPRFTTRPTAPHRARIWRYVSRRRTRRHLCAPLHYYYYFHFR